MIPAAAAAARTVARRAQSTAATAGPKVHKWKDIGSVLEKTRPVDPHPHLCFEPPYGTAFPAAFITTIVVAGYGSMYFGMRHQQYKQGYWK